MCRYWWRWRILALKYILMSSNQWEGNGTGAGLRFLSVTGVPPQPAPASLSTNTRPHASMLRPWCQCSTASHSSDVLLPLCLCLVNDWIFEDWWWKTLRQNCIILAVSASIGVQYYSCKVNFNKIDSEQYWAYEWPWSLIWLLVNIYLLTLH